MDEFVILQTCRFLAIEFSNKLEIVTINQFETIMRHASLIPFVQKLHSRILPTILGKKSQVENFSKAKLCKYTKSRDITQNKRKQPAKFTMNVRVTQILYLILLKETKSVTLSRRL